MPQTAVTLVEVECLFRSCGLIAKIVAMDIIPVLSVLEITLEPTQGLAIDLLDHAEDACRKNSGLCVKHVLINWYQQLYPTAQKITRPGRFETSIRRIGAPTGHPSEGFASWLELTNCNHIDSNLGYPDHGEMKVKGIWYIYCR